MTTLPRFDSTVLQQLNKALIGFDRMFEDRANYINSSQSYPPYNIIKRDDNNYEIEIAVAGFSFDEIDIEVNQNVLTIKGAHSREDDDVEYLHRGLAYRSFEKSLMLAEHMQVGDAIIQDGVLRIAITRIIPDALKPRKIQILSLK